MPPSLPDRPLRRQPYPHEVAAATDFAALDIAYEEAAERIHRLFLEDWLPAQTDALAAQILAADSEASLAAIRAPVVGVESLTEELLGVAQESAREAASELAVQGADAGDVDDAALRLRVADHAAAVGRMTADGISIAASRRAVQLYGERSAEAVAAETTAYLTDLKHDWEKSQLQGAVGQARGVGRFETFRQTEAPLRYAISALLEANTCEACVADDGREFDTLEQLLLVMPSGGNASCFGGPRCRCVGIAIYDES